MRCPAFKRLFSSAGLYTNSGKINGQKNMSTTKWPKVRYRKLYSEHDIIDMLSGSIPVAQCSENISVCLEGMPVCSSYDPWEKIPLW